MNKTLKQTFLKRRHTNKKLVCEKVLSIVTHYWNVNKKHNGILFHTSENGFHQKDER
jgi:hypothetical protein